MRTRVYVRFDDGQLAALASLHGMVAVRYHNSAGMPAELGEGENGLTIVDTEGRKLVWKRILLSRVGDRTIAYLQMDEPKLDDWPLVRVHRICRHQGFALVPSESFREHPEPRQEWFRELVAS